MPRQRSGGWVSGVKLTCQTACAPRSRRASARSAVRASWTTTTSSGLTAPTRSSLPRTPSAHSSRSASPRRDGDEPSSIASRRWARSRRRSSASTSSTPAAQAATAAPLQGRSQPPRRGAAAGQRGGAPNRAPGELVERAPANRFDGAHAPHGRWRIEMIDGQAGHDVLLDSSRSRTSPSPPASTPSRAAAAASLPRAPRSISRTRAVLRPRRWAISDGLCSGSPSRP